MSVDRAALVARLAETFLEELDEHLRTLTSGLLALERGGDAAPHLPALFRGAHSLKGAARSVGAVAIEGICHRLEGTFAAARDGRAPLDPEQISALLADVDAIERAGAEFRRAHAPPAAEAPRAATAAPPPDAGVARVPIARLDHLVAGAEDLLVARRRAERRQEDVEALLAEVGAVRHAWRAACRGGPEAEVEQVAVGRRLDGLEYRLERLLWGMDADARRLRQVARPLEDALHRARMVPFSEACRSLERDARDAAVAQGRAVEVVVSGGEVEIDRVVLEALRDPLRHLVRNAVVHGIEGPADRRAAGKPEVGRVTVSAALRGAVADVTVADDGRGLDLPALRARAERLGLAVPADAAEQVRLAFAPGLTTAAKVSELAGRGVGLDIVLHRVEALHGQVTLRHTPGAGTQVTLQVPVTLARFPALLVTAAGETYALPMSGVRRIHRVPVDALVEVAGRPALALGGPPVPVVPLARVLGVDAAPAPEAGKLPLVVVSDGATEAALAVDALLAAQEVVARRLGPRLEGLPLLGGATLLAGGRVALIVNPGEATRVAHALPAGGPLTAAPAPARPRAPRLLVVDDSITTRGLVRTILEAAGFRVRLAADGAEAWDLLEREGADLVVSDVEMPRLDGFALTERIRASRRFAGLPVVLVTARETDADRRRGLDAGADAYLAKSAFDQSRLVEVIRQLL